MPIYTADAFNEVTRVIESVKAKYGEIDSIEHKFCVDSDLVYTGGATSKLFHMFSPVHGSNGTASPIVVTTYFASGGTGNVSALANGTTVVTVNNVLVKGLSPTIVKYQAYCMIINLVNPIP